MLEDLNNLPDGSQIDADVCIIGAGAAGITLAGNLMHSPLQVCLLESGGFDFEPAVADLGSGENLGNPYYDLVDSRLRFFGGTTNIWGGRCVPLDPEDFDVKSWVPHSGWPISHKDLDDYYAAAHQQLDLGVRIRPDEVWSRLDVAPPELLGDAFTSSFWYFDEVAERFNSSRCGELLAAANIQALTHASVTHLQAAANGRGLTHVLVQSPGGRTARVSARTYVLAAGAIENARLMLASRDVVSGGIGNSRDQVGRYFMEHPHGRLGRLQSAGAFRLWSAFQKRFPQGSVPLAPVLRPSRTLQEREGILNTALTFKLQRDPAAGIAMNARAYRSLKHRLSPTRTNRALWHAHRRLKGLAQRYREPLRRLQHRRGTRNVYAMIRAEQAPNPESRVMLSASRDAMGIPRADLQWRTSSQDKHTLVVLARALQDALEHNDLGSFTPEPWLEDPSPVWPVDPTVGNHPIGGYHHMGTTRMAASPAQGVVDKNCQVFGYPNLYVAGSSLFPTGGWANPTLTIIALTHRLADHIRSRLTGPGSARP